MPEQVEVVEVEHMIFAGTQEIALVTDIIEMTEWIAIVETDPVGTMGPGI